jgi:single-strand DNA-binding protein
MTTNSSETFTPAARKALQVREDSVRLDVDPNRILDGFFPLVGMLGGDPELRFTPSGQAVCNFNVAYDVREKKDDQWISVGTMWVRVNVWGQEAENCAETLRRGNRILAFGTWKRNTFTAKNDESGEDEQRTVIEFTAREIGPSLLFTPVHIPSKSERNNSNGENEF